MPKRVRTQDPKPIDRTALKEPVPAAPSNLSEKATMSKRRVRKISKSGLDLD